MTTTIALSLDETLLERIQERATELRLSPNGVLLRALEEYLAKDETLPQHSVLGREEKARRLQAFNEAWADELDAEERAVLQGTRKKYAEAVRDPW